MDDQLKLQMKEFEEAVNSALSHSDQIARAIGRIKEAGYEILVKLETTLGVRKRSEGSGSMLALELGPNPTVTDDQLQQLVNGLREAIKSELDSEHLVHAAAPIKEQGYQPFITLEANIRIRRPTIH